MEMDFPASALKERKLKEISIELAYIPSSYKLQTAGFPRVARRAVGRSRLGGFRRLAADLVG